MGIKIKYYSVSKKLQLNTKNFLNIKYYSLLDSFFSKKGIFYGWGRKNSGLKAITVDKTVCSRRNRELTVEEIFAGAYILYSYYYNPYTKKDSDI